MCLLSYYKLQRIDVRKKNTLKEKKRDVKESKDK